MELEIWQAALLCAVGCVAGFLNVMAGGGSLLAMPVMVMMGMKGPDVNGTVRLAIAAQNVVATTNFVRHGFREFRRCMTLAACAIPGTVIGAYYGTKLEGVWFNRVLAVVMIVVMIVMIRGKKGSDDQVDDGPAEPKNVALTHALMVVVGFYGGFFQAGVGFLFVAILHRVLGLDLVRVNMHKVVIIGTYTLVAMLVFASRGHMLWAEGIVLAVGYSAGGWLGSHCVITKGEGLIRVILYVALAVMAAKLLLT